MRIHKHECMKHKWVLPTGVILLSLGIIFRFAGMENYIAIPLMATGGLLKIYYIALQIWRGFYKPGYELLFLIIGLMVFFSGIAMKYHTTNNQYIYLMIAGLTLKVIFVVLFIRHLKKARKA